MTREEIADILAIQDHEEREIRKQQHGSRSYWLNLADVVKAAFDADTAPGGEEVERLHKAIEKITKEYDAYFAWLTQKHRPNFERLNRAVFDAYCLLPRDRNTTPRPR